MTGLKDAATVVACLIVVALPTVILAAALFR